MSSRFFLATGRFAQQGFITIGGDGRAERDERLVGSRFNDRINGLGGDDLIEGLEGDDTLDGDDGRDRIFGDAGDDLLKGGRSRDTLDGGSGDDFLSGGRDADDLDGGRGDDLLRGNGGDDLLHGGDGSDMLEAGPGDDILTGGAGNDLMDGGAGTDTAVYEIAFADIELRRTGPDTILFVLPDSSEDRLAFVETADFADGRFEIGATTEDKAFVFRLFAAVFDRLPGAGFDHWTARLSDGATRQEVAHAFTQTPEYAHRYGADDTDEALLEALFDGVLGRAPTEAGRAFWLARLDTGLTEADLLLHFADSPEFAAKHAEVLEAGLFYAG